MTDFHCDNEIWESVTLPEFSARYRVSNLGRVRSEERSCGLGPHRGVMLRLRAGKDGYLRVGLRNVLILKLVPVHRLVALAFVDNPEGKPQVNHIDGNILNNNAKNLEWVTVKENAAHSRDVLKTPRMQKAVCQYDLSGVLIHIWPSATKAAEALGFNRWYIRKSFKNGLPAFGSLWKRADPLDNRCRRRKVIQMTLSGDVVRIWESVKDARIGVGCGNATIHSALKGTLKTCKGFKWKFADE